MASVCMLSFMVRNCCAAGGTVGISLAQQFLCQSNCPHYGVSSEAVEERSPCCCTYFTVLYDSFNSFLLFLSFNCFLAESRRAQQQAACKWCPTKPKGSSGEEECPEQNWGHICCETPPRSVTKEASVEDFGDWALRAWCVRDNPLGAVAN